jgi:hypothetical protein
MDCPTCGLANPPGALKCDCGYDFSASKPADFPGWPISLAWGQKLSAFWSISWPAWIVSFLVVFLLGYSGDLLRQDFSIIAVGGNLAFLGIQALLTPRLVRKNYRSFRVYVVREDGTQSRKMSIPEAVSVWLWILWPQFAFLLLVSLVVWSLGSKAPDVVRGFSTMLAWFRVLVVGPYAVGLAVRVKYAAFRLEARGFRYV